MSISLFGQENRTILSIIQKQGIEISNPEASLSSILEVIDEDTSSQWITLVNATCNAKYIYSRKLQAVFVPRLCGGESNGEYCSLDILSLDGRLLATWKFVSKNQTFHSFVFYYSESPDLKKETLMKDKYKNRSKGEMSWRGLRKAKNYYKKSTLELSGDEFFFFCEDVLKLRKQLKPDVKNSRIIFPYKFCHD